MICSNSDSSKYKKNISKKLMFFRLPFKCRAKFSCTDVDFFVIDLKRYKMCCRSLPFLFSLNKEVFFTFSMYFVLSFCTFCIQLKIFCDSQFSLFCQTKIFSTFFLSRSPILSFSSLLSCPL